MAVAVRTVAPMAWASTFTTCTSSPTLIVNPVKPSPVAVNTCHEPVPIFTAYLAVSRTPVIDSSSLPQSPLPAFRVISSVSTPVAPIAIVWISPAGMSPSAFTRILKSSAASISSKFRLNVVSDDGTSTHIGSLFSSWLIEYSIVSVTDVIWATSLKSNDAVGAALSLTIFNS